MSPSPSVFAPRRPSGGRILVALILAALAGVPLASAAPAGAVLAGAPRAGREPSGDAAATTRKLALAEAIQLALDNNLRVLVGDAAHAAARAEELAAAARLRPRFDLAAAASRQVIDLEAYGIPLAPGQAPLVGPFDLLDLRLSAASPLLDFAARDAARAGRAGTRAAAASLAEIRDLVVLATGNLYLETLAERGRIASAEADFAAAESIDQKARDRHATGAASSLDVLRADAALEVARSRRTAARAEHQKSLLRLARLVGLPLDPPLELTGALVYAPLAGLDAHALAATAQASRADLAAARARVEAAELSARAAAELRWPTLGARGDLGEIGPSAERAERTWTLGAGVRVPLFDGGEISARRAAAEAALTARRGELADLEREVDYDVRAALLDLDTAAEQVATATAGRDLAERELAVARDRFAAGLDSSLDVISAQQAAAAAREAYLASLYGHNAAKASLARALGLAEEAFAAILEGKSDELRNPSRDAAR